MSSAAETIDQLIVPHTWSGVASGHGRQWADVYAAASTAGLNPTTLTYFPNEDKARSSAVKGEDYSTTTNLWNRLDDATNDDSAEADYIINTTGAAGSTYRMQFGSAGISSTKRVVAVTFQVRAKGYNSSWQSPSIVLEWWNGSTKLGNIGTITPNPQDDYIFRNFTIGPFYLDFYNGGFWLQPEIVLLDNNTSRNLGLTLNYSCAVSRIAMEVMVVDETRVAVGIGAKQSTLPSGVQTNLPISFKTPLGVDNWAKASGTTYYVVTRRLDDPFNTLTTLSPLPIKLTGHACPHGQGIDLTATLADQGGNPTTIAAGTPTTTHPFVLGRSDSAQSVDSQPYWDLEIKPCHTASTLAQGMDGASAQSYKRVRLMVGVSSSAPTSAMNISIRKVSDNSQLGGTGTLSVADLADTSIATSKGSATFGSTTVTLYDVTVTLPITATLAAATTYYVQLDCTTASTNPWYVMWLDATASHSLTGNITFDGAAGASVGGAGTAAADFPLTVGSIPTSPTAFVVSLAPLALPGGKSMDYASLSWNATSLSASFTRYEVQRSIDAGVTWTEIHRIVTEPNQSCEDYEGPRNTATSYRIRAIRSDAAASDWTTQSGTVTPTMDGGLLVFTSNDDPTVTTGFVVHGTQADYTFLSGSRHVRLELHDRDYSVVFKPTEKRGVVWPFTLQIHTDHLADPVDGSGTRAFDTILAVAEATVPYLCVHTFDGERLFGSLAVPSGTRIEPVHGYLANCEFTQTQADSTSVSS